MSREITSKNIDGITDLVVIAPIKDGFIKAYENVTYATRLRIVAEALHRIRVSAREHEFSVPFSDTTERIQTLLDFRIGVLDKDLFGLGKDHELQSKQFLYLTATFDGAWEPYMRLIWDPLGPFLDLLFCNCEGYVAAGDNSFKDYAAWVRANQMDSGIFYSTTGLTVKDHLYLSKLDRLQRAKDPEIGDLEIARMPGPQPEIDAQNTRNNAIAGLLATPPKTEAFRQMVELALEALTVLYRLADFYPPEWYFKTHGVTADAQPDEGRYLLRVARSLLEGWPVDILYQDPRFADTIAIYKEPLDWFRSANENTARKQKIFEDPPFDEQKIQGGILKPIVDKAAPIRQGALLLMTVTDPKKARHFIKDLKLHYEGDGNNPEGGFYRTIAFAAEGLERIGLKPETMKYFPKEFREGMETRSGLLGDMRENHPRRWTLPQRNWPLESDVTKPRKRPPVEMSEVDFVIQIRTSFEAVPDVKAEIDRLANAAAKSGAVLAGFELMKSNTGTVPTENGPKQVAYDHFKFRDGVSQPNFTQDAPDKLLERKGQKRDDVRLGEIIGGYRNDHSDFAPRTDPPKNWFDYQLNGSYLVIRKLQQHVEIFDNFLKEETARINQKYKLNFSEDDLAARILGRQRDGTPLVTPASATPNDFDYKDDAEGIKCPFASHIRRTNPRSAFQGRPDPRIARRGMLFDNVSGKDGKRERGLMFMAYGASIAEQFETIQRWINGANSSGVGSAQNDPLMGVSPKIGERMFRFEADEKVVRVQLPKDPFVSLHWGLYLFAPSREAIEKLCTLDGGGEDMDSARENLGRNVLDRLDQLPPPIRRAEWKRLLEDFYTKDPSEDNQSPHVWSAIRWYKGGSHRIDIGADK
jgi:Dyp-type peroxidase family